MNGHVVKRGKGRYSIVLELGTVGGKRVQKWISGFTTSTAAKTEMIRLLRELQTGQYIEPTKLTVGEWMEEWLDKYSGDLGRKTRANYESIVNLASQDIGHLPLRLLRPMHLQTLYDRWQKDGIKASTIGMRHAALHSVFERAVKLQILGRNPCIGVVKPRQEKSKRRALSDREIDVLLREAPQDLYTPILLSLYTGLRRGEILALQWANVHEDRLVVTQSVEEGGKPRFKDPKTKGSKRTVTLPSFVAAELQVHKRIQDAERLRLGPVWEDLDLVCPDPRGRIMSPNSLSLRVTKLMRSLGIKDVTYHCLRHTHATQLMSMGFNPKIVQERLGHSTISQTMDTYSHVSSGMQDEVARTLEARKPASKPLAKVAEN